MYATNSGSWGPQPHDLEKGQVSQHRFLNGILWLEFLEPKNWVTKVALEPWTCFLHLIPWLSVCLIPRIFRLGLDANHNDMAIKNYPMRKISHRSALQGKLAIWDLFCSGWVCKCLSALEAFSENRNLKGKWKLTWKPNLPSLKFLNVDAASITFASVTLVM